MLYPRIAASLTAAVLALSLYTGCSSSLLSGSQVAKVNQDIIGEKEFETTYQRTLRMMRLDPEQLNSPEQKAMADMFKKVTLENLIFNRLVAQEAKKRNLSVSQEEFQQIYNQHLSQMGGEKKLKEQLAQFQISLGEFQKELKDQLLKDKLVQAVASKDIKVPESDVRRFYDAHPQEFDQPEQVRARHILISADRNQIAADIRAMKKEATAQEIDAQVKATLAEKRKKAEQLFAEAKAHPEQFEALAKENSDDKGSAQNGGDLGYFAREVMVPTFSAAAFSGKPGQVVDKLVETPFGFHIIQVLDHKAPMKQTYNDVKPRIMAMLEGQRKQRAMETWLENEKRKAKIEISPEYQFDKEAPKTPDAVGAVPPPAPSAKE